MLACKFKFLIQSQVSKLLNHITKKYQTFPEFYSTLDKNTKFFDFLHEKIYKSTKTQLFNIPKNLDIAKYRLLPNYF